VRLEMTDGQGAVRGTSERDAVVLVSHCQLRMAW
jgi:hypothetical protein